MNAILHHCRLPTIACVNKSKISEYEDCSESSDSEMDNYYFDQSSVEGISSENSEALVRPGIVHRLDKGTSGLLVVAKVVIISA